MQVRLRLLIFSNTPVTAISRLLFRPGSGQPYGGEWCTSLSQSINRYLAKAFIDQPISDASRTISWAMFINITVIPMITGFGFKSC